MSVSRPLGATAAGGTRLVFAVGRLHIVSIAALGTFTFGWLFTGRYPWLPAAVTGLDWFLVNLINRAVDLTEDEVNEITGTGLVARYRRAVVAGGLAALGVSLVGVHLLVPAVTPLRLAYHALGLGYNFPLRRGGRRLKQLYFWKNTASAVGFMLTVFGYPLAAAGWGRGLAPGITAATVGFAALFFFLFELSYEVIYDLRDAPGDARAGVRSYAVVHGLAGATRIVDGLIAASMLALAVGYGVGALPWRIFIMISAPVLQLVLYKRALRRGITASDCTGLTWLGAALLVTYHLWILADLPGAHA